MALLCDGALGALTNILNLSERAVYPLGDLVDIVFLAKPGGGERPIGLMCALYRVWSRCRRKYARAWERHHSRAYFGRLKGGLVKTPRATKVFAATWREPVVSIVLAF